MLLLQMQKMCVSHAKDKVNMDAYDIAAKIQKYWAALYPKSSGELIKVKSTIRVCVYDPEHGFRDVVGVRIFDDFIELKLEEDK